MGFFAQDSWKVMQRLTLELGLRYDWNQTPTEALNRFTNLVIVNGQANLVNAPSPYNQNNMNFQPRAGFSFDVFGTGRTILRSGFAVLTDQPITNLVTPLTGNPPFGNPQAFAGGTTAKSTYTGLLASAGASGLAPTILDPNFKNGYVESYNLNIQQQLSKNWSLMVGYFGSEGHHLRTRVNLNQFLLDANGHVVLDASSKPIRPFPSLPLTSPVPPPNPANPTLGNISDNVSIGNSNYNALWVSSNMRPWHGLQFNASYTFSKSLDYTSQNGQGVVIQNSLNPLGDYGPSDFDARHRFAMNFIYDVPALRQNRFFQGWQVGSIISDQSGNPVNLVLNGLTGLTGLGTLRPDLLGPVQYVNQPLPNGNIQWFNPSVCTEPCTGATFGLGTTPVGSLHFGNLGRNAIIGPGFNNVDFSLIKKTKINERFSHEMRFEAFDLLNHPNFGQPGRLAQTGSTTFGVISNTRFATGDSGSSRQLQFAMKLVF